MELYAPNSCVEVLALLQVGVLVPGAAVNKSPQTGDLHRNLVSHGLEARSLGEIKVWAGFLPPVDCEEEFIPCLSLNF